jgi:hypothetical protein
VAIKRLQIRVPAKLLEAEQREEVFVPKIPTVPAGAIKMLKEVGVVINKPSEASFEGLQV